MKRIEFPYHRRITVGFLVIAISLLIMGLPSMLFTITEDGIAQDLTIKYWLIPSLLLAISGVTLCYFIFFVDIRPKRVDNNILTYLAAAFRIIFTSAAVAFGLMCIVHSVILVSNNYSGSKKIMLNATIVDYHTSKNKTTTHHIVVYSKELNRKINFTVDHSYQIGQKFVKHMNIGRWGILYAYD